MSLTNDNSMQMAQTVNSQPTTTYIPKYNAQGVLIEEDMIVSNNGQPITIYAYKYSDQGVFTEQDITNYASNGQATSTYAYKYSAQGILTEEDVIGYKNGIAFEKDIYSGAGQPQSRLLYNQDGSVKETDRWINGHWEAITPTPPTPTPGPAPTPGKNTGGLSQKTFDTLISQLTNPGLKNEIISLANSGKQLLSYQSMLDIMNTVSKSVGSSGLSASQFKDLQNLITAMGSVSKSNDYIYSISNALVNGNPSNAAWTGGGSYATALGNLTAGSSAAQLNKLIEKWFLGEDNPTTINNSPGEYVKNTKPLFSSGGIPLVSDVNQGGLGDCYYLAALADVAQDEPELIKSMFSDNGNGTYGVRFYNNGQPVYITVDSYVDSAASSNSVDSWVQLAEKAYVEFRAEIGNPSDNKYNAIAGGWSNGLTAVTGTSITEFDAQSYANAYAWNAAVDKPLIAALNNKQDVLYACNQEVPSANGLIELVPAHMYPVLGYDAATDALILRNPWGGPGGQGFEVQIEVPSAQLWGNGENVIFIGNRPASLTNATQTKSDVTQLIQAMGAFSPTSGAHVQSAANAAHMGAKNNLFAAAH